MRSMTLSGSLIWQASRKSYTDSASPQSSCLNIGDCRGITQLPRWTHPMATPADAETNRVGEPLCGLEALWFPSGAVFRQPCESRGPIANSGTKRAMALSCTCGKAGCVFPETQK